MLFVVPVATIHGALVLFCIRWGHQPYLNHKESRMISQNSGVKQFLIDTRGTAVPPNMMLQYRKYVMPVSPDVSELDELVEYRSTPSVRYRRRSVG